MTESIGFIGLGLLGLPMATNLLDAGYALRVYNRTASKAAPLEARGAHRTARPADAISAGGIVVTALWDGPSVESVVTSDGFLDRLGRGGIHISTSTILPETAEQLAALHADHGSIFVEATVFGRPEAAAAKQLWVPIAGPAAAKARAVPVLEAMGAKAIFDFGERVGAANVVKLAGNFLIVSATRALGEALAMADKAGVDAHALVDMLTTTLFPSSIYQSYGKRIADKAPAMTSKIPAKDIALFRATAERVGAPTPMATHLADLLTR